MKVFRSTYANKRDRTVEVLAFVRDEQDRNDAIQQVEASDSDYVRWLACYRGQCGETFYLSEH